MASEYPSSEGTQENHNLLPQSDTRSVVSVHEKGGEHRSPPLNGYARLLAAAHEPKGQQSAAHQQGERDECRHGRDGATGRGKGRNGGASGRRAILLNGGLPILLDRGRAILLTHRRD